MKPIQDYKAPTEQQRLCRQAMLDFAAAHSDCFHRSCVPGHFTASAWLLNKSGDKALLMHHTKLDRWMQLGGHTDGDSDLLAVAVKEAQEESGIQHIEPVSKSVFDLDIHEIPANSKDSAHLHYDVRFLLQVKSDEDFVTNRESKELRWIGKNPDELPTQEESVARLFRKWVQIKMVKVGMQ